MKVFEINEINEYLKRMFDNDEMLNCVYVHGEISNYKKYPSGHHYFTVKDAVSSLKCVMFRNEAYKLRFIPENGMKVTIGGRISIFPRDGAYQMYASVMQPDGIGDLQIAFEQLKRKLEMEGVFSAEHKKKLPTYPHTIAIITSPVGAALQDMLRIIKKRYPITTIKIIGVRVQGAEAPGEISEAIQYANKYHLADLIITGRGGGSIEDLWAFNDERVARAIYQSEIPVISAVGHEPDVTISDYAADLRAATPSNAAELAVPDCLEMRQHLNDLNGIISAHVARQIHNRKTKLNVLACSRCLTNPASLITDKMLTVDNLQTKLISQMRSLISLNKERYGKCVAKLDALSPLKVLARGYSLMTSEERIIRSAKNISTGDNVVIHLVDGTAKALINEVKINGE